jgi:hypothetical protein
MLMRIITPPLRPVSCQPLHESRYELTQFR